MLHKLDQKVRSPGRQGNATCMPQNMNGTSGDQLINRQSLIKAQ